MTTQLMYPGAMVLRAALEGWIQGEAPAELRPRAGEAYAANQKILVRSATAIFSKL